MRMLARSRAIPLHSLWVWLPALRFRVSIFTCTTSWRGMAQEREKLERFCVFMKSVHVALMDMETIVTIPMVTELLGGVAAQLRFM